jgi:protein TonB
MNIRDFESNLGLFIALSVLLHVAAAAALYYFAPEKGPPERREPYIVRIVPPEPIPPETLPPGAVERAPEPVQPEPARKAPPPKPEPKPEEEREAARVLKSRPPKEPPPSEPPARGEPEAGAEGEAISPFEKAPEAPGPGEGPAPAVPGEPGGEEAGEGRAGAKGAKERLFDPDVLAGVIEKGRPPRPPDSGITFDTEEIRRYSYMRRLKARIEAVWEYPREAATEGIYGDLVIKFVIKKDGSLGAVELVRTSGWQSLDKAALAALRDGDPYWPLPEEWGMDALTVTGHFIYSLSGYYYLR